VPIVTRNQAIGALYHDNRLLCNAFNESQLELLPCFATLAALVLENAEAEEKNRMLNEKVQEMESYYEDKKVEAQDVSFMGLVGESPQIRRVISQVKQVAQSDATVLILGETGVGKEVVARAIHMHSSRRHKPFIPVNCSALSESLIHSELFGHEKGSFTGADHRRVGRFEKASEGTLFLDEIGELPLDIQVRLLRVLERKEFERVGGTDTLRSDFRLIAATNRDLEEAVKKKRFRDDLFYRINVFRIYIPPLRDRREDIPVLVDHFLKIESANKGKTMRRIPSKEMLVLTQYDWPGNVRELRNIIERWAISEGGPDASISAFLDSGLANASRVQPPITLKENERRHILWGLERTRWKIHGRGGAAELLDIHPNTLAFRMKKLGIKRPKGKSLSLP
jgi:transcriptional regulator with GAF, ATPase, and Fis domain